MKKKLPTSRVASRAKKRPFRFRWWMALIGVGVVSTIGIVVLRYSYAAEPNLLDGVQTEFRRQITKPIGQLSTINTCSVNENTNAKTGTATGWAINRARPTTPTLVDFYVDEDRPSKKKFSTNTSLPTPANILTQYPSFGNSNGFAFDIPREYYDGQAHTLTAFAIGNSTEGIGRLNFSCSVVPRTGPPIEAVLVPDPTAPTTPITPPPNTNNPGTQPIPNTNIVITNRNLSPSSKLVVANTVAKLVKPTNDSSSSTVATVNLIKAGESLNAEEIAEINKQIDALQASDLVTLSAITPIKPNITNKDVVLVGYYVDKRLAYYSEKSPFVFDFDTTRYRNGTYRVDVVGFNAKGEQIVSQVAKFSVENNLTVLQRVSNVLTYPVFLLQQPR